MGASPHLPHTKGVCSLYILPLPYPARPPWLQASWGGGVWSTTPSTGVHPNSPQTLPT